MARIAHDTPMKAYDHVVKLLAEAGSKDGVILRTDAQQLVAKLEAEGRGTEALAANNIFMMLDGRDQETGGRITTYDLNRDRVYVEKRLLENRDIKKDGFARSEIAKMSVTGRALVELGRMLELDRIHGRVAHDVPKRGLFHIAALLRAAGQQDIITSRADIEKYAGRLHSQGRGTEALALRTFGGFIDNRDNGKNRRITDADITAAVDYALQSMLRNKDGNNNGYSKDEIAKSSTSAKAFFIIGRMIENGIIKSAMPIDGKDARQVLSGLVKNLEFDQMGSEGGAGIRAVHREGTFKEVNDTTFRKAFDMPKRPLQLIDRFTSEDLRTFLQGNMNAYKNGAVVKDEEKADKAFHAAAMLRSLDDLKVVITGAGDEGSLATYIVGIAPDGSMLGIQTAVVWT